MCRALDSHGFADLKAAIYKYASLTSMYPLGDLRRFNLGTPAEVFRCIERAFSVAPSSKRIVEDILVLDLVLDKIIEAEGCVVPDEDMRHGRRARATEWTSIKPTGGELKPKARARQRKETIMRTVPVHPLLRARGVTHAASATTPAAHEISEP